MVRTLLAGAHGNLHHLRNGGDFGFLEGSPENRRGCRLDTHSQYTSAQYSLFKSAERTPRAWLKSHGLHCHLCAPEKSLVIWCCNMSHVLLLTDLPRTTSTSSSSFSLPSTTRLEYAAQSVQQDPLQERPVHHAQLQAPSVDKQRHQESLWRENLQSGGTPRTTTPTFQTEQDKALAKGRRSQRGWSATEPQLTLQAVKDEDGRPLEVADESGARLCSQLVGIFEAREGHYQDLSCETTLDYVQIAPGDRAKTNMTRCWSQRKNLPRVLRACRTVYRCAGGMGSQLLCAASLQLLDEVIPPT